MHAVCRVKDVVHAVFLRQQVIHDEVGVAGRRPTRDAIDRLGIRRNTIILWCADNGAEARRPWRGSPGPWSGFYNTVMEGGIRTPCIIRWTGRIPPGRVFKEIIHEVDFFPTFAAAVGADLVPKDRAIDGVNQLPFLEGKQTKSNRESVIYSTGAGVMQPRAVKWRLEIAYRISE